MSCKPWLGRNWLRRFLGKKQTIWVSKREGLFEILKEWVWIFVALYEIFNCRLLPGFLLGSAWVSLSPEVPWQLRIKGHEVTSWVPPRGLCIPICFFTGKATLTLSLLALRNFPFPFLWFSLVTDIYLVDRKSQIPFTSRRVESIAVCRDLAFYSLMVFPYIVIYNFSIYLWKGFYLTA